MTSAQTPLPKAGDTFLSRSSRPYTENGQRAVHTTVTRYRVTDVGPTSFHAVEVEGLSEENRPAFAGRRLPGGSLSMLLTSWPLRVADGEITPEEV